MLLQPPADEFMSDLSELQSSELLNPIPDMFIVGWSELAFLFAMVSAAPVELEILRVH